eukprot:CAMPEP_0202730382 /NCGR_PEP_ID=MMETSP1385-20130828/186613_1 /ASSEMBLY_ACC=CAM_ASM_000861 /TAXON_ID=933848 /ORGANISM="Elphidium margaritaceum" /LENGTH=624 /DNA_ID=CAMNT_0049396655 /DNA_START=16 /DNA_END=1890 /DNA_ORIENTATION=+
MAFFRLFQLVAVSLMINEISCGIAPTSFTDTTEYYVTSDRDGTFEGAAIECSKSECHVTCDETEGCVEITINAEQAENLFVTCSGTDSCKQAVITGAASQSTQIDCTASAACAYASFDVGLSPTVSVTCAYSSASSLLGAPCLFATFKAQDSTNLFASCTDDYSCYYTNIWCPSSSTANGQCTIDCDGGLAGFNQCSNLNVYIDDALTADHVSVDCRSFAAVTCTGTEFKCVSDQYSGEQYPSTELVYSWRSWGEMDCVDGACCPIAYKAGVLDCSGQTQNCVIDCVSSDCSNYAIDGSQVTSSLTVNCDSGNGGCSFADIKCPTSDSAVCTVNCLNANACEKMSISAAQSQSLDLSCDGSESCSSSTVFCPAHSVDACSIACTDGSTEVCADMHIYSDISYVVDFLSLECTGSGCSSMRSYCNVVDFLSLDCTGNGCSSMRSYCTNYFGVSGSKQYTELEYSNTEWQCQTTTLSCCPWQSTGIKPDPVSGSESDGDDSSDNNLPANGLMIFLLIFASIAFCILCAINGHCASKRKVNFVDPNYHVGGRMMYGAYGANAGVQVVHVHHHHQQPAPAPTVVMVQPQHVSVPSAALSEADAPPSYAQAGRGKKAGRGNTEGQITNV